MTRNWSFILALLASLGAGLANSFAQGEQPSTRPKDPIRLDSHGVPLPRWAVARLGRNRFWHQGRVAALAISRDRKTLALLGSDGVVRLWEAATGKEVGQLQVTEVPKAAVGARAVLRRLTGLFSLRFSPDGKLLVVSTGDNNAQLWDLTTRKRRHLLPGGEAGIQQFAFSHDGKTLATVGLEPIVRLWSVANGKVVGQIKGHEGNITTLVYSLDGRTLVTGSGDQTVRLWDVGQGKERQRFEGHRGAILAVAISMDGKKVASCAGDGTIRIWDTSIGKQVQRWWGQAPELRFSADASTLTGTNPRGVASVWKVDTGRLIPRDPAPAYPVRSTSRSSVYSSRLSSRGSGASALSRDGQREVRWRPAARNSFTRTATGGQIEITDVRTGKDLSLPEGHQGNLQVLAWSPDGKLVASGGVDGRVILWDPATGKQLRQCLGHTNPVSALAFHPNSRLLASAAAAGDQVISLWDVDTGKEIRRLRGMVGGPGLAFSADGKFLLSQRQNTRSRFGAVAGRPGRRVAEPVGLLVWDLKGKASKGLKGNYLASAFTPDGKTLVAVGYERTAADGRTRTASMVLHRWNLSTWKQTSRKASGMTLETSYYSPTLLLSPDTRLLVQPAGNGGGKLALWDLAQEQLLRQIGKGVAGGGRGFSRYRFGRESIQFSADGRSLVTAISADGHLRVWEVASGGQRCELPGSANGTSVLCISPGGRQLATGSADGTILLWDLSRQSKPDTPLANSELATLWADLGSKDAARAYQAICRLRSQPGQAVAYLRGQLKPAKGPPREQIARLVANLESDQFTVRKAAEKELQRLGARARPALEQLLKDNPKPEARRRLKRILALVRGESWTASQARLARAVEVLEQAGTPEARRVLEALARKGQPGAQLTRWAQESLARLARRSRSKP